jgi:hypothetical protein
MNFRVSFSKHLNAWLVIQNSDDIVIVGFNKAKYAHRTKNFLNSGGAFDGNFPSFFYSEVEIFDGDINVSKQES